MKILLLGQNGLLGNIVFKYFLKNHTQVEVIQSRWNSDLFKHLVLDSDAEYIINCIGAIPQRGYTDDEFKSLNVDLPIFLESTGKKVIHPSTDCEFSGNKPLGSTYDKTDEKDAEDAYGKSKAEIARLIENDFKNTKIIRTSIIGPEQHTNYSLMNWFLNAENEVSGYTNHYWNGVTTHYWSMTALNIIEDWDNTPVVTQIGTKPLSKYDLLCDIADIYNKKIKIIPITAQPHDKTVNKCLTTDFEIPDMKSQLQALKLFSEKL
jgi:dTDP-4-dehydrorhamnose reductase